MEWGHDAITENKLLILMKYIFISYIYMYVYIHMHICIHRLCNRAIERHYKDGEPQHFAQTTE